MLLFCVHLSSAQEFDFDSAVSFLERTKPDPLISTVIESAGDKTKKAELTKIYSSTVSAIDVIHQSHKKVPLKVLLPYIGFTPDVAPGVFVSGPAKLPTQDMEKRRKSWPVFSLILDMPDASASLKEYCMDSNNPINSRLDAFQVLAYLDPTSLNKIAGVLRRDITNSKPLSDNKNVQIFIDGVVNGKAGFGFDGGVDLQGYLR